MRVPIFDQTCRPPSGWDERFERDPERGSDDVLDGRVGRQTWTIRSGDKCPPLRDEYAYNAGLHRGCEAVHDFLIETDVEVVAGAGTLALRLCDGQDWVEVTLPANAPGRITAKSWPMARRTMR